MFYCPNVQLYHLCGKSRFVCAHIGQNRHIYPPSIYVGYILTRTPPPPFAQVDGGGCYREKFFLIFIFRFSYSISTRILFFLFFQNTFRLDVIFISILYSFDYDLGFTSSRLRFSTLIIILDSVFFDSIFRLVSALFILRFNS